MGQGAISPQRVDVEGAEDAVVVEFTFSLT